VKFSTYSILVGGILGVALPCYAQQPSASSTAPAASTAAPASTAPAAAPASTAAPSSSGTPTDASSAPATAQSPPAGAGADKSEPSAETIKRAKSVGLRPEEHRGQTLFCWEDASTGSRFTTKKCTDETGLDAIIAQREVAKSNFRQTMTGTSTK
jgi:hypothetical protein